MSKAQPEKKQVYTKKKQFVKSSPPRQPIVVGTPVKKEAKTHVTNQIPDVEMKADFELKFDYD